MDIKMLIRSGIFFTAGLVLFLFPDQVNKFQNFILKKLHFKRRIKKEKKRNFYTAVSFFIVAFVLMIIGLSM